MNPTIAKPSNAARLAFILEKGEGKATARCLTPDDVADFAARLDSAPPVALSLLPRDAWKGAIIDWRPRHRLPNSYKYRADATAVRLERRASGWALVKAWRETANESEARSVAVRLPRDVAEAARQRFESTFAVDAGGESL